MAKAATSGWLPDGVVPRRWHSTIVGHSQRDMRLAWVNSSAMYRQEAGVNTASSDCCALNGAHVLMAKDAVQ